MFVPSPGPASVLEAPFQITVEFTDYASYQHHQLRRRQYQEQLERQEREQQEREQEEREQQREEQQRLHQDQLQQSFQQSFHQSFQQQPFLQSQPGLSPSYHSQFQQLPQQLPSDQRLLFYQQHQLIQFQQQQQQQQQQQLSEISANPQALNQHSAPSCGSDGTPAGLINVDIATGGHEQEGVLSDSPVSPVHAYGLNVGTGPEQGQPFGLQNAGAAALPAATGQSVYVSYEGLNGRSDSTLQGQLSPAPIANSTAPTTTLAPAAAAAFCISPVSSVSPTYFTSPPLPPAPATAGAPSSSTSTVSSLPATTANYRQVHLRRQQYHNHNNQHSAHGHYVHSHHQHHQHLQQQILQRRIFKLQSHSNHYPGFAATTNLRGPPNVSGVDSQSYPYFQFQQLHHHQLQQSIYSQYAAVVMADETQQATVADQAAIDAEIKAQEAAAQEYKPEPNASLLLSGPGIDELRPTEDIKQQFEYAHFAFAEKTQKLPRAYPLYRKVLGDGNCGWRAIGFSYFEALVYNGDVDLIASEKNRLLSLNDYIRDVGGYDPYVYEDMVEETDILFGQILEVLPDTEKAMELVTNSFNDDGTGNAIIYHLRLLTASHLKENVEKYGGFIVHDEGLIGYCQEYIERPNCEIDHLRIEVLASILLKASDIVLEIAYLDRSLSDHIPVYSFPDNNIGRAEDDIGMRMSLLFRPDHYDILYRASLPSAAVAKAVLESFYPPEAVQEALEPNLEKAYTVIKREPIASQSESYDDSETCTYPEASDNPAQDIGNPIKPDESFQGTKRRLSASEDTPDLTPGSSINSPARATVKTEPLTPTPALSIDAISAGSFAAPQAAIVTEEKTYNGTGPKGNGLEGVKKDESGSYEAASTATPTAATPSANLGDPRGEASVLAAAPASIKAEDSAPVSGIPSTVKFFKKEEETAPGLLAETVTQYTPPPPPPPAPSSDNNRQVHHVITSTNYVNVPGLCNNSTNINFLARLPGVFTRFPVPASSFGSRALSSWSSAPKQTGFQSNFLAADNSSTGMPSPPVASLNSHGSAISDTPMSASSIGSHFSDSFSDAAFSAADTSPGPVLDGTTPITSTGAVPLPLRNPGGSVNNAYISEQTTASANPVRFTKWYYEPNSLHMHDATDPDSSSFRNSRVSTAHFDNPEFQPEEYRPSEGDKSASSKVKVDRTRVKIELEEDE